MASNRAENLFDTIEKRVGGRHLTPYNRIETLLLLGGKPDNKKYGGDGLIGMTEKDMPKTDAILGVNEHPPILVEEGKAPFKASLWMAIHDRPPFPGTKWLQTTTDFINDCIENDWTIYVHCSVGKSRSAMVVIAYLMYSHKWSMIRALNFLLSKRPVNPIPAWYDGLWDWEDYLGIKSSNE